MEVSCGKPSEAQAARDSAQAVEAEYRRWKKETTRGEGATSDRAAEATGATNTPPAVPTPPEASSSLDDMVSVLGLIKDLVPEKVVTQARRAPCPKSARAAHESCLLAPSRCTGRLTGASLRSRIEGGGCREGPSASRYSCRVGFSSRGVMTLHRVDDQVHGSRG